MGRNAGKLARSVRLEDESDLIIPPRSELYHLEPRGLGTSWIESLSSYTGRLAAAHHVSVVNLADYVMGGAATRVVKNKDYFKLRYGLISQAFVCLNAPAKLLAERLGQLTNCGNLEMLTAAPLASLLRTRELTRHKRAWCPACLAEASDAGTEIYEPLLWLFRNVTVCPKHNVVFSEICSNCGSADMKLLSSRYRPGLCSACGGFLGRWKRNNRPPSVRAAFQAAQFGDVLQSLATGTPVRTLHNLKEVLSKVILEVTNGNLRAFGRLIGTTGGTVWGWLNEEQHLSPTYVLRICEMTGLPLRYFLTVDARDVPPPTVRQIHKGLLWEASKPFRKRNWQKIYSGLTADLQNAEEPPSLNKLALKYSVDRGQLRKKYPDLVRNIVEKRKRFISHARANASRAIKRGIRDSVRDLRRRGIRPSRTRIVVALRKKGLKFWQGRKFRETVKAACSSNFY